jgi:hypothetical protein
VLFGPVRAEVHSERFGRIGCAKTFKVQISLPNQVAGPTEGHTMLSANDGEVLYSGSYG